MSKLVLVDGHAILHRAYHALPPLTTTRGIPINAVYGFASMLLRVINDLKPTHLIVTFDRPTPTFRNKIFKDYQIQRPKMENELISQIDLTHRMVEDMGIPIFEMDGYEADDLIGTLALQAKSHETVIVTGDRDMLQLITDNIKIFMPVKGLSESKLFEEKDVVEKYGIKPKQIIDFKALTGDPADNYPGVEGIGPKTASTLLQQFGSLDGVYKHVKDIKSEAVKEKLVKGKESAYLSQKLAQIVTDAPIKIDMESCRLPQLDNPKILSLFDELEFRSLIPRLLGKNNHQTTDNRQQKTKNKEVEKDTHEQTTLF